MAVNMGMALMPGFGDFRFAEIEVRGQKMRGFAVLPDAVGDLFRLYLERNADRDWLIYEEERYTFGQAQEQIDALSAELVGTLGLVKGDVVGLGRPHFSTSTQLFRSTFGWDSVAILTSDKTAQRRSDAELPGDAPGFHRDRAGRRRKPPSQSFCFYARGLFHFYTQHYTILHNR